MASLRKRSLALAAGNLPLLALFSKKALAKLLSITATLRSSIFSLIRVLAFGFIHFSFTIFGSGCSLDDLGLLFLLLDSTRFV